MNAGVKFNLSGTVYNIISWEEEQSCEPAIRPIPLSNNGAHVDYGTFILKARTLNMTIRLSDADKTAMENLFNLSTWVTITSNDHEGDSSEWLYNAWFLSKPITYEYVKQDGIIKEWRADLSFLIDDVTYTGNAYVETNNIISIDGNYFSHIIDSLFNEKNDIPEPDFVNQDTIDLDINVWNRDLLSVTYVIRMSTAGRWLLDQLLIAHEPINLTDVKYGINGNIWIKTIREKWDGEINWSKPWQVELNLIII